MAAWRIYKNCKGLKDCAKAFIVIFSSQNCAILRIIDAQLVELIALQIKVQIGNKDFKAVPETFILVKLDQNELIF